MYIAEYPSGYYHTGEPYGEYRPVDPTAEKFTVTAAEKLMDSESKENTLLGTTMIAGILKTVVVVTKNVPEETANWINTKIKEAMTPQTKTIEAPQEQPAVDGQ